MDRVKEKTYNIGLVLSGGGARGFAHLGVYKAMEELGIKPDIISGTSAGAIVGAMIASGLSVEESTNFFHNSKMLHFVRPTVSKMGIMVMAGFEKLFSEFIQTEKFEDLKIPLVVTATDMNEGVPVHFHSGELVPRVVASCSIPIVFTPAIIDDHYYVDGGVFMNFPVTPIRDRCKVIIGVLLDTIEPSDNIKNMLHLAQRSFNMGVLSNSNHDAQLCDILIAPKHLSNYSMFDLENIEDIYNEGYSEATAIFAKPEVKELLKDIYI